jgi:2-C-methyl-D-erythritol 2,4-cyclodiphosphate synthase
VKFKIGQGFDIHPFVEGRPLILGGITIPHTKGLAGHSDADALLHAITDALLGAAGKGDLGHLFPDTDSKWKDADSKELLKAVVNIIHDDGWLISNIDSTIVTEEPKIAPFRPQMITTIAKLLDIAKEDVSVKATTSEKMGFIGRKEGLLAMANVLIYKTG